MINGNRNLSHGAGSGEFGQEVENGCRSVSAGLVAVEQQALGSTVWVALAPLLEDLGQAVLDIPIRVDRLPVLERYDGCMAIFREEACQHLCCNTLRSLELHRWGLTWENPHSQLLLCFGSLLKIHVSSSVTMPQSN